MFPGKSRPHGFNSFSTNSSKYCFSRCYFLSKRLLSPLLFLIYFLFTPEEQHGQALVKNSEIAYTQHPGIAEFKVIWIHSGHHHLSYLLPSFCASCFLYQALLWPPCSLHSWDFPPVRPTGLGIPWVSSCYFFKLGLPPIWDPCSAFQKDSFQN